MFCVMKLETLIFLFMCDDFWKMECVIFLKLKNLLCVDFQKMDWEWKLKELSGTNPTHHSDALPPIDDLHIPMVHVSDDFDLDRT